MIPAPQLTCDECGNATAVTQDDANLAPGGRAYAAMTKRNGFATVDLCRTCRSALNDRRGKRRAEQRAAGKA